MKLELLYFDGCPSYESLLPRLEALLEREGVEDAVELRQVESLDAAGMSASSARRRFGSTARTLILAPPSAPTSA